VSAQMWQREKNGHVLALVQLIGGVLTGWVGMVGPMMWLGLAEFSTQLDPALVKFFHFLTWYTFDGTYWVTTAQFGAIGLMGLFDDDKTPLFPRWTGVAGTVLAVSYISLALIPFDHTGAFSYDGLVNMYFVWITFFWYLVWVSVCCVKDLKRKDVGTQTLARGHGHPEPAHRFDAALAARTMRHVDLTPLYKTSIGFDHLASVLDQLSSLDAENGFPPYKENGFPPYNIERIGENTYRICMAVAGFGDNDLSIEVKEGTLTIRGEKKNEDEVRQYIHQDIAARNFERRFRLAECVELSGATLEHGLLHIDLKRELPEAMKPRTITITKGQPAGARVIESDAKEVRAASRGGHSGGPAVSMKR